jgi:5-methylcytosine-specific restriction endonuclease McrA
VNRPCLDCGCVIPSGSRCSECRPPQPTTKHRVGRTAVDRTWRALSQRLRKASPFCEIPGCPSKDLTVDHIVPLGEDASLAHEPLNCRVLCRAHNAARGANCTDEERNAVYAAIKARKDRQQKFYLTELAAEQRNN